MGPVASQEVDGREERMEEMKGEWRQSRREGTLISRRSLVTRVTRGEEESREERENLEEESKCGREEEGEEEGVRKVEVMEGNLLSSAILSGGFDRLDVEMGNIESESGRVRILLSKVSCVFMFRFPSLFQFCFFFGVCLFWLSS